MVPLRSSFGGVGRGATGGGVGSLSLVPQFPQKWAFSGLSAWHFAHFIFSPSPDSSANKLSIHEKNCNISILHIEPALGYNTHKRTNPMKQKIWVHKSNSFKEAQEFETHDVNYPYVKQKNHHPEGHGTPYEEVDNLFLAFYVIRFPFRSSKVILLF